ncbi:MAG: hypothetical protein PCFJNLEI_02731 [Verrucomicrobiae bacterium]|nr:hypothetical protein [Verrucomicrobiae bacterium]
MTAERTKALSSPVGSEGTTAKAQLPNLLADAVSRLFTRAADRQVAPASLVELKTILLDATQPRVVRLRSAKRLATTFGETGLAILKEAAASPDTVVRALVAEALGECRTLEAREVVLTLVSDADAIVQRRALQSLGAYGDATVLELLTTRLAQAIESDGATKEVLQALARNPAPAATVILQDALSTAGRARDQSDILVALGQRPLEQTQRFFESYLRSPNTAAEMRVVAVQAFEGATYPVTAFLLPYVDDQDPDVRAAAIWSIATAEDGAGAANTLVARLTVEEESDVRLRLYQALNQFGAIDVQAVLGRIVTETDLPAQVAGYGLWANQCRLSRDSALGIEFDRIAVPLLADTALSAAALSQRLQAVIALRQAKTGGATQALQTIAANSTDDRVAAAARGGIDRLGVGVPIAINTKTTGG